MDYLWLHIKRILNYWDISESNFYKKFQITHYLIISLLLKVLVWCHAHVSSIIYIYFSNSLFIGLQKNFALFLWYLLYLHMYKPHLDF
jgi:hypothetical protein